MLTAYFTGELDEYAAEPVRRKLDNELENRYYSAAVFDFTNLQFMDSTGIGMLLGRYKTASRRNIKIYIRNASPQVEKLLIMTGIYRIMPKIGNEEAL